MIPSLASPSGLTPLSTIRFLFVIGLGILLGGCDAPKPETGVGRPLPELRLTTPEGTPWRTRELLGRSVVLNFWATWCGPCRDEMPSLERLKQKLDPTKTIVMGISLDTDPHLVQEFVLKYGITFPVALDPQRDLAKAVGVHALPVTFLLSPDGVARERLTGERHWDEATLVARIRALTPNP